MRIIKNSHSGIGGIATEGAEVLKYVKYHPEHFLSLIHRDVNHLKYYNIHSPNTSTHYIIVTKEISKLFQNVRTLDDFYNKYKKEISRMENVIDEEMPDVSFCSGSFYYPWLLLQASKNKGMPIAISYAGIVEKEETEDLYVKIGKDFINSGYLYIFPSEHAKKTLEKIHNISLPNSHINPNGIDCAVFNNRIERSYPSDFNIAFVGRISPVKNPEYCATLASALRKSSITANFLCVTDLNKLISMKDSPYYRKIADSFEKEGIKLIDFKSSEDLAEFYCSCSLIITPSHFETFGNVPLEAIATGTPALINKEVGVREVFNKIGLKDFILDFEDVDSVVKKIKEIKDSKLLIGKGISNKVIKDYNWSLIIDRNFSILNSFLRMRKK